MSTSAARANHLALVSIPSTSRPPFLHRRGLRYCFKRKVPADCRELSGGQRQLWKSLGTDQLEKAKVMLAVEVTQFDLAVARHRKERAACAAGVVPLRRSRTHTSSVAASGGGGGDATPAALAHLYCQARIFKAAKGIPAWREPSLLPLVVGTGLAEGAVLAIVLDIAAGAASTGVLLVLLIVLVVLRAAAWWRYRSRMKGSSNLPNRTRETLASIHSVMLVAGTLLPLVAAGTAWAIPAWQTPAAVVAALLAIAAGWQFKFALVTKAAQVQGYALGATLRRGHPLAATRRQ